MDEPVHIAEGMHPSTRNGVFDPAGHELLGWDLNEKGSVRNTLMEVKFGQCRTMKRAATAGV